MRRELRKSDKDGKSIIFRASHLVVVRFPPYTYWIMSAFTQEMLDKLEAAIASGAMEVRYSDKIVKYQSLTDMLRIRALMRRELGLSTGTTGRVLLSHDNGLNGGDCDK